MLQASLGDEIGSFLHPHARYQGTYPARKGKIRPLMYEASSEQFKVRARGLRNATRLGVSILRPGFAEEAGFEVGGSMTMAHRNSLLALNLKP